jgi:hypothetical protein
MASLIIPDTPVWDAARITEGNTPVIGDALEILKYLAKMKSVFDDV